MLLEKRIKLVLLGLSAVCIGWMVFIEYSVVYRTYGQLEQSQATEDIQRCVDAIRREGHHLEVLASDWGAWDDTYRFIQDHNPEFQKTNLNPESMESADLNLLCLVDQSNSIVWYSAISTLTKSPLTLQAFSQPSLPPDHPLLTHHEGSDTARLLRTEHGVVLVASSPIFPSKKQGPALGTVIMGRFFGDANVEKLVQETHVRFTAWNLSANSLPAKVQEALARVSPDKPVVEPSPEADALHGYAVLQDIFGRPALLVDATIQRTITALGWDVTWLACMWLSVVILIVSATFFGFLNRSTVWPILRLCHRVTGLNLDGDPSRRIPVQGTDEISSLATAFNAILDRLAQETKRREQAESQVRQAKGEVHLAQTSV